MLRRAVQVMVVVAVMLSGWCVPAGAATTPTTVSLMSSLGGTPMSCPPGPPQPGGYCPPPVYPGVVVRFTATVAPQSGSGAPTGSVTFFNGATSLGSVALDAQGSAFVDVTAGAAGTSMSVTASYGGDSNFGVAQSGAVGEGVFSTSSVYTPNTAGFILDGLGGLHPWSQGAGTKPAIPAGAPYWPHWNIARGIAINQPSNSCSVEVDGLGGIFQLTWPVSPATVVGASYWPTWDIVRDVILMPDCSGGYVLDGWGVLHPFGLSHAPPPAITNGPYWSGWDIARAAVMLPDGSGGYIFDAWGVSHPFALPNKSGPSSSLPNPLFQRQDIVRGATIDNRFGILLVEPNGATVGVGLNGTVVPASLLGQQLSIPLGEGIAAFGT
jgi:hypothetical protein